MPGKTSELSRSRLIIPETINLMCFDNRIQVLSEMFQESAMHNKGVQYLGLYGMGGLGKTTMCRALYWHFWSKFSQRACIVDLGIASRKLERQKDLMTRFTTLKEGAITNIKDSDVVSIHRPNHFSAYRQSRHVYVHCRAALGRL